ncbi:MAG: bifunctional phosphoribosyl-AMP cyclohydrolase/phosphoribosyl-ATP diphosphatase HisIE [Oscillospiraceae bacterium]|nr:bifunctional phosphoribosyl-AMP cyclohydrolase/phosphoribosyl-ATP diphosphatase HisIE [Oscillospiraceae bacterium]
MQIEGLLPAIVQDYYTGRVLMLAYVNQESYDIMMQSGYTCFWSRSRQELWRKGDTSGNVQRIMTLSWDCDRDTLLIQVEQIGAGACHTGSYSCFGNEEPGQFGILDRLWAQILDRRENPREKSYTNYLFDQGLDKICKKIGEEAAETIIAAKNDDGDGLVGEISDLAYHLLVLMSNQGVAPRDIQAELDQRHGVKGNLKEKSEKGGV